LVRDKTSRRAAAERAIHAHLVLATGHAVSWSLEHGTSALPVRDGRRRCLLDHLERSGVRAAPTGSRNAYN
jgi:hypothetical protein